MLISVKQQAKLAVRLYLLVCQFRRAIDLSFEMGEFEKSIKFQTFPRGCCGDTCYLLAEYLRTNKFETVYVCGRCRDQSHAWLVLKDDRVKIPLEQFYTIPEIKTVLYQYGEDIQRDEKVDILHYAAGNTEKGIVIDITGDQFGESAIYVGELIAFTKSLSSILLMTCTLLRMRDSYLYTEKFTSTFELRSLFMTFDGGSDNLHTLKGRVISLLTR